MTVRVGAFSLSAFVGGAERWILDLIRHTRGPDVDWRWLVIGDESYNKSPILREAASLVKVAPSRSLGALSKHVDVIVGWGLLPGSVHAPVIATSHWDAGSNYARRLMAQSGSAARVVAVSKTALNPMPPAVRQKAIVIYNGVDPARVKPTKSVQAIRSELKIPPGKKVLGYLGRLSDEKRVGAIVKAASKLPRDWVTVLVGIGSKGLRSLGPRHKRRKVIVAGARHDVGNVLSAFDRLVLCSKHEGFGLVIAEAWLAGVPVISTPVGIAKENPGLVRGLQGGMESSLAVQIANAVKGDTAPSARVQRARSFAQQNLTTEVFGRRWRELLVEFSP